MNNGWLVVRDPTLRMRQRGCVMRLIIFLEVTSSLRKDRTDTGVRAPQKGETDETFVDTAAVTADGSERRWQPARRWFTLPLMKMTWA